MMAVFDFNMVIAYLNGVPQAAAELAIQAGLHQPNHLRGSASWLAAGDAQHQGFSP